MYAVRNRQSQSEHWATKHKTDRSTSTESQRRRFCSIKNAVRLGWRSRRKNALGRPYFGIGIFDTVEREEN